MIDFLTVTAIIAGYVFIGCAITIAFMIADIAESFRSIVKLMEAPK